MHTKKDLLPPENRRRGPAIDKEDRSVERKQLLAEFGMMSEEELALLFGVEVKTLKNKPRDLPAFVKIGGKRLFVRDEVVKFMRRRTSG